jgi:hypothetical protein
VLKDCSFTIARMEISPVTRREFLQSTAASGAAAALMHVSPGLLLGQSAVSASAEVPAWASKPMRWAQLTLVEDDPAHFDPGFWLDYFKRTRSDGVCLSGGGCVAYYPTEIANKNVAMERTGSIVSLSVPSILDHEVVALDL